VDWGLLARLGAKWASFFIWTLSIQYLHWTESPKQQPRGVAKGNGRKYCERCPCNALVPSILFEKRPKMTAFWLLVLLAHGVSADGGSQDLPRIPVKIVRGMPSTMPSAAPPPRPTPFREPKPFSGPTEFESLRERCIATSQAGYEYVVCPFANVTQRDVSGGSQFFGLLGIFEGWNAGKADVDHAAMRFTDGCRCGGKRRKTTVTLTCAPDGVYSLRGVKEGPTCEYTLELLCPEACSRDRGAIPTSALVADGRPGDHEAGMGAVAATAAPPLPVVSNTSAALSPAASLPEGAASALSPDEVCAQPQHAAGGQGVVPRLCSEIARLKKQGAGAPSALPTPAAEQPAGRDGGAAGTTLQPLSPAPR
jgi:hypothetical protein